MENGIVARRVAVKITDGKVERIESNGLLIEGERECMAFLGLGSGGETAEQDGDERIEYRRKVAWRDHYRKLNENYTPWELYSIVTFASEQMPRSFEEANRHRDNYRRRLMRSCPAGEVCMELLGIRGGRWKIEMRSRGIPAAVIHGKWGKGGIWMQTASPRRKVEYDKSRLVVRYCGRAVRKRPEGWKAP